MREALASHNPENERIQAIADAANERKISVRRAVTEIVGPPQEAGSIFAIGTPQTNGFHHPNYGFKRYSRAIPGWHYLQKPGPDERPVLIATKLPKVAIITALFGDINEIASESSATGRPKSQLDPSITSRPRPHFGWKPDAFEEDGVKAHALPELINAAPQLTGSIDFVRPAVNEVEPFPDFGLGMYLLYFTGVTIASVTVLGRDLPDITATSYKPPLT